MKDSFLSEEDLDLKNLSYEELMREWNAWFDLAQSTNEYDKDRYSHACFGYEMPKGTKVSETKEIKDGKE